MQVSICTHLIGYLEIEACAFVVRYGSIQKTPACVSAQMRLHATIFCCMHLARSAPTLTVHVPQSTGC